MSKPTVFVSCSLEGRPTARELSKQLEPLAATTMWSEGAFHPGKTVIESLTEAADRADFAVFVLTPDDVNFSRKSRPRSPHVNVVFELGFLAGRVGLERTILVITDPKDVQLPADLAGTLYVPIDTRAGTNLAGAVAPAAAAIRRVVADLGRRAGQPSDFFSCFISYSWNDKNFAAQLHDDLQKVGVRCWLDAKEMRTGDNISEQIERALQAHDKILLILSEASVGSSSSPLAKSDPPGLVRIGPPSNPESISGLRIGVRGRVGLESFG